MAGIPGIADPILGERPIQNVFWASMRARCLEYAKAILADNNFEDDEWSVLRTAKAVGVAIQKASVELSKYVHGVKEWPASQSAPARSAPEDEAVRPASDSEVEAMRRLPS